LMAGRHQTSEKERAGLESARNLRRTSSVIFET
jgi:hypothetical protein